MYMYTPFTRLTATYIMWCRCETHMANRKHDNPHTIDDQC